MVSTPISLARLKLPRPLVPRGFGIRAGVVVSVACATRAAARAARSSLDIAFRASIELDQKSIKSKVMVDMRHLLYFRRSSLSFISLAFASPSNCAFVMLVAGVSFHRWLLLPDRAIVRREKLWKGEEKERCTEKSGKNLKNLYTHTVRRDKHVKFDRGNVRCILEFVSPLLLLFAYGLCTCPRAHKTTMSLWLQHN